MKELTETVPNEEKLIESRTLNSFYEGLYSEESLSIIGEQIYRINPKAQCASYDKYAQLKIDSRHDSTYFGMQPEEGVVQVCSTTEKAPYGFRTLQMEHGPGWLDRTMYDLGRNTGIRRENALVKLILDHIDPISFSGGTSRGTVSQSLSWRDIHRIKSQFDHTRVPRISYVLRQGPRFSLQRIPSVGCYVLIVHPHLLCDLRDNKGFRTSSDPHLMITKGEAGRINDVHVLASPNMPVYRGAGVSKTKGERDLEAHNNHIDVYPIILAGARAWASIPLRTRDEHKRYKPTFNHRWQSEDGIVEVNYLNANAIQSPSWIAVFEVGVKNRNT